MDQGGEIRRGEDADLEGFGGTAEPLALWFQSIGHQRWFYYYLTAVIATSLVVYVTMRDTKKHSAIGR